MIAFTNHALDHMLCSVLDAGITTDMIRLGSRTSDERISQYSIEMREMVAGQSRLDHASGAKFRELKDVGTEITKLIDRMNKIDLESDSSEIVKYLELFHPEHHFSMTEPRQWVEAAKGLSQDESESGEKWQKQGRKGKAVTEDTSMYAFWKNCGDLEFLDTVINPIVPRVPQSNNLNSFAEPGEPGPSSRPNRFVILEAESIVNEEDEEGPGESEEEESDDESIEFPEKIWMNADFTDKPDPNGGPQAEEAKAPALLPEPSESTSSDSEAKTAEPYPSYVNDAAGFFAALGEDGVPAVPLRDRTLETLLDDIEVWEMSQHERQKVHAFWVEETRTHVQKNQQDEFDRLRKKHAEKVQEYNEIKEEVSYAGPVRVSLLNACASRSDVIC